MDGLQRKTLLKWMIWRENPNFWKHSFLVSLPNFSKPDPPIVIPNFWKHPNAAKTARILGVLCATAGTFGSLGGPLVALVSEARPRNGFLPNERFLCWKLETYTRED